MELDSGLLRAFVAAADEHNFGRAAQQLLISQQALSKRISRLEQLLGVTLFDRTNKRVSLTETGRRLLPFARQAMDTTDAVVAEAAKHAGPLRVDVLDEHVSAMLVARAAARLGLVVEARTRGDHHDAVTALRNSDVDIALGRAGAVADPWPADVLRRVLLLEPIRLLVGESHPLATRPTVRLPDLRDTSLWFPMAGAPAEWTELVDELSADFGLTVDRTGSTLGFEFFLARMLDHQQATFFGGAMSPPGPQLRVIPIVEPIPVFGWWAMWRRRVPEARVAALIDLTTGMDTVSTDDARDPARVWLPARDRALLPS